MMQDIRSWFSPLNKKTSINDQSKEKKRKIIDSDDEDPLPRKPIRKQKVLASDSDDDIFDVTPQSIKHKAKNEEKKTKEHKNEEKKTKEHKIEEKKTKEEHKIPSKNHTQKPTPVKLKPTSAADFFSCNPVSHTKKHASKRKAESSSSGLQTDDSFEKTLQQLDATSHFKKPKKEEKSLPQAKNSVKKEVSVSSFNENALASKLSEKMRNNKDKMVKKPSIDENKNLNKKKSPLKIEIEKSSSLNKTSPLKIEIEKSSSLNKTSQVKKKIEKSSSFNKKSPLKIEIEKPPPKVLEKSPKKEGIAGTPSASKNQPSTPDIDEQKKQRVLAYKNYLQRSGPKNHGSKPLPEGQPNCLAGMTFVITGVLDSLDREEASDLVKKYGGKVTSSVSKNTTYLVVGEDPGVSKMNKGNQLGTKILDEDGLFRLIEEQNPKDSNGIPGKETQEISTKLNKFKKKSPDAIKLCNPPDSKLEPAFPSKSPARSVSSASPSSARSSPSSKSCSQSTEPISSQDLMLRSTDSLMWVDKYKPTTLKNIIGQQGEQSNAKKLLNWLKNWASNQSGTKKLVKPGFFAKDNTGAYFKAALLSGPPGVGKTTTAHIVSKELGFDVVEMNASDTRSKRALNEEVSELLSNKSLSGFVSGNSAESTSQHHVLLMDEVDGMAGNEDRGGVRELIELIKKSKVPVICMCNDRNHQKIRSLANHCFDLRFQKPRVEQIRGAMMSVCFREGIKLKAEGLDQIIIGSNQDIRQVLHHLSMWSADQKVLETDVVKHEAKMAKKEFKIGPWDVCTKVFSESAHKEMSIHDKVSLFFHDYSFGPLFIQENYLKVSPHCARGNRNKLLEQVAKTSLVLADSDIIEKAIRSQSAWSLLPTQALFSSVCPGQYMEGHFSAQVEFPRWFGNNSKKNKMDRLSQELLTHMRLRISGSKQDIITDYSARLLEAIATPLASKGAEGVSEAVDAMIANDLLREDLESIVELSTWPGTKDKMANVESKVKAAFTRKLNKEAHMTPFSNIVISKKSTKAAADHVEYGDEEFEEEEEEEEDDEDITKDAMIKAGKLSQKKESAKKGVATTSKGKGKGKARK